MTKSLCITVNGIPTPQGSKIPGFTSSGQVYLREAAGARLYDWRDAVAWQAIAQSSEQGWELVNGPVTIAIEFYLPRPKTVKRDLPSVKPDIDKIVRSTFDGITQSGCVWKDDAQAVRLVVAKDYEDDEHPAGAVITVQAMSLLERTTRWLKAWKRIW